MPVSVEWEPGMSVGVEEIDERHRQILRRVRHLARAAAEGGAEPVRAALRSLQYTLSEHHAVEEAWMEEQGYPAAGDHVRDHRAIVETIGRVRADGSDGARLAEVAAAVARMLDEHMRSDDLRLGRFFTARQNFRRLAESGSGFGMSLTPMPGTFAAVTPVPGRLARAIVSGEKAARAPGPARHEGGDQAAAPPDPRTTK